MPADHQNYIASLRRRHNTTDTRVALLHENAAIKARDDFNPTGIDRAVLALKRKDLKSAAATEGINLP